MSEYIINKLSQTLSEKFLPADNGDVCWEKGSESFSRKEVAHLLWTQIAMISNDLKSNCGNCLTPEIVAILGHPRIPEF